MAELFYCTTGWHDGCPSVVHPILANSEEEARAWMNERYNRKWAQSYTKAQWEENKWRAIQQGWLIEQELPLVDLTGGRVNE